MKSVNDGLMITFQLFLAENVMMFFLKLHKMMSICRDGLIMGTGWVRNYFSRSC